MNTHLKYMFIGIIAIAAGVSGCKKCKDCAEYLYKDDSKGRPQYSKISKEFCNDDLTQKEALLIPNSDTTATVAQFTCE